LKTLSSIESYFCVKEAQGLPPKELELSLSKSLNQYFTKSLEDNSFIAWIAEYEGKTIGFSGMLIRDQPGNFEIPNGKTGYILNIYTLREYRKNEISSLLIKKLIDEAKERKLDRIELHATKYGEPIYRKIRFIEPHFKVLEFILN